MLEISPQGQTLEGAVLVAKEYFIFFSFPVAERYEQNKST